MIALLLLAAGLQSPKGAALFPSKLAIAPPPGPTVVLKMPAGFDWTKYEVQLESTYDLQYGNWTFVAYASNGVPIMVADNEPRKLYRLRALKVSTKL